MADKNEGEGELPQDSEANSSQNKLPRPVSGMSGGSTGSKKSMMDAVGQLTSLHCANFDLMMRGQTLQSRELATLKL
jgi:hypothetical protein